MNNKLFIVKISGIDDGEVIGDYIIELPSHYSADSVCMELASDLDRSDLRVEVRETVTYTMSDIIKECQ